MFLWACYNHNNELPWSWSAHSFTTARSVGGFNLETCHECKIIWEVVSLLNKYKCVQYMWLSKKDMWALFCRTFNNGLDSSKYLWGQTYQFQVQVETTYLNLFMRMMYSSQYGCLSYRTLCTGWRMFCVKGFMARQRTHLSS